MRLIETVTVIIVGILISMSLANYLADQATLRDCAMTGQAKMVGGGVIECAVKKEQK